MPTLDNETTKWAGNITISKKTGTVLTLSTDDSYVEKDIELTLGVQSGVAVYSATADADIASGSTSGGTNISSSIGTKTTTEPTSGYFLKVNASGSGTGTVTTAGWFDTGASTPATASETKYFPVDGATASVSGTNTVTPSASISGSNVTLSNTNNGIAVTATGGGTASASATATSTGAGYVPDNTQMASGTINASSLTTTASSYISGVTLGIPASGTNTFAITLPNGGSDTITLTFTVDAEGNWSIE